MWLQGSRVAVDLFLNGDVGNIQYDLLELRIELGYTLKLFPATKLVARLLHFVQRYVAQCDSSTELAPCRGRVLW